MSFDVETTEAHEKRITRCKAKGCNARIVFLPTPSGKSMPVDADTVEADDAEYDSSRHVSHFSQCVGADSFRKPR